MLLDSSTSLRVAVVHDYLNQRGGAERVALELARLWPKAPVYTSLYRPTSTFPDFAEHRVVTSWLDRAPVDGAFRNLFPLYPLAFRSLGPLDQEVVVSSSSGWAHGIPTAPGTAHVVYCHTPARWLYRDVYLGAGSPQSRLAKPLRRALRRWDQAAARRPTLYVANSHNVRRRIQAVYGRDAEVVYPPVEVERFKPSERGDRLLVVSRLIDYKRIDAVISAANRAKLPLDVVGTGPSLPHLQQLAGPTVTFHGRIDDAGVTTLMETCRSFVLPGEEDFGITPVEANAAGKPVVALAAGGALESIQEGVNGTFFRDHTEDSVLAALRRADDLQSSPVEIAERARRFSPEAFAEGIGAAVDRARGLVSGTTQSSHPVLQ